MCSEFNSSMMPTIVNLPGSHSVKSGMNQKSSTGSAAQQRQFDDVFTRNGIQSQPVLMLAPMEGVTNSVFRDHICRLGGVDLVATEFVRITSGRQKVRPFKRHMAYDVPLQIQLMGTEPDTIRDCITFLQRKGVLFNDDWIDLNVGCPSKKVNAGGAGAALLLQPEKLCIIVEAMRAVHPGPLSIKTRVGFDGDEDYPRILKRLSECQLDFITIHARTKCGGYDTPVLLDYLTEAVSCLPFPVIGNGDVFTPVSALQMVAATGVRGVMCGRGVLQDPLLFRSIRRNQIDASIDIQQPSKERLARFALLLLHSYQQREKDIKRDLSGAYKEFCVWLSKNPLIGSELFQSVKRCKSLNVMEPIVRQLHQDARLKVL